MATNVKVPFTPPGSIKKWTLREQLILASAVQRSGDQNWMSVSRAIKPLVDETRPSDYFSLKNCASQYSTLLDSASTPKRKRKEEAGDAVETVEEQIVRHLTAKRIKELDKTLIKMKEEYISLRKEIEKIEKGEFDEQLQTSWESSQNDTSAKAPETSPPKDAASASPPTTSVPATQPVDSQEVKELETDQSTTPIENDTPAPAPVDSSPTTTSTTAVPTTTTTTPTTTTATPTTVSYVPVSMSDTKPLPSESMVIIEKLQSSSNLIKSIKKEPEEQKEATSDNDEPVAMEVNDSVPSDPVPNAEEIKTEEEMVEDDKSVEDVVDTKDESLSVEEEKIPETKEIPSIILTDTDTAAASSEVQDLLSPRQSSENNKSMEDVDTASSQDATDKDDSKTEKEEDDAASKGEPSESFASATEGEEDEDYNVDDDKESSPEEVVKRVTRSQDSHKRSFDSDSFEAPKLSDRLRVKLEEQKLDVLPRSRRRGRGRGRPRLVDSVEVSPSTREEESEEELVSAISSAVPSPTPSQGEDSEVLTSRNWRKTIMLVWRHAAQHKYATLFLHPVKEEDAPGYHDIVHRPMDLTTIKKNIETGIIRTDVEFQRDMLLMFQNALMYNSSDHHVYEMAYKMCSDVMENIQEYLLTQLMVHSSGTKTLRSSNKDGTKKGDTSFTEEPVKKRRLRLDD